MSIFNEILLPKILDIPKNAIKNIQDELEAGLRNLAKLEDEYFRSKQTRDRVLDKSLMTTLQSIDEDDGDDATKQLPTIPVTHSAVSLETDPATKRQSKKRSKHEVDGVTSPEVDKRQKRNAAVKAQAHISDQGRGVLKQRNNNNSDVVVAAEPVNMNLSAKLRRESPAEARRRQGTDIVAAVTIKQEKLSLAPEPMETSPKPPPIIKREPTDVMPPPARPPPKRGRPAGRQPSTEADEETGRRSARARKPKELEFPPPASARSTRSSRASSRAKLAEEADTSATEAMPPPDARPKRTRAKKKLSESSNTDAEKENIQVNTIASPTEKPRPKRTRRGQKAAEKEAEKIDTSLPEKQKDTERRISPKEERISRLPTKTLSPVLQKKKDNTKDELDYDEKANKKLEGQDSDKGVNKKLQKLNSEKQTKTAQNRVENRDETAQGEKPQSLEEKPSGKTQKQSDLDMLKKLQKQEQDSDKESNRKHQKHDNDQQKQTKNLADEKQCRVLLHKQNSDLEMLAKKSQKQDEPQKQDTEVDKLSKKHQKQDREGEKQSKKVQKQDTEVEKQGKILQKQATEEKPAKKTQQTAVCIALDETQILEPRINETVVLELDSTMVIPNGVYQHAPVTPQNIRLANATVTLERSERPTMVLTEINDATMLLDKVPAADVTDDSILTEDNSVEGSRDKTATGDMPKPQPKSAVKQKVQQFEQLAARTTRTKTRQHETEAADHTPPGGPKHGIATDTLAKMDRLIFSAKEATMSSSASKPRAIPVAKPRPASASASKASALSRHHEDSVRLREDARKKKEAMLEAKREQQRRKREEKIAAAAAAREAAERERRLAMEAAARERQEKQAHADQGKLDRLREVERKKQELARKVAETEERRRAEEQARQQRLAEEQKRAEAARKKQLEEAETMRQEAALAKEMERRQKEYIEKQKLKQRLDNEKSHTPGLAPATPLRAPSPTYMADGFQYLHPDEDHETVTRPDPAWYRDRKTQLAIQAEVAPSLLDRLLPPRAFTPDLREVFPGISRRRLVRTSSAVWRTPPHHALVNLQ